MYLFTCILYVNEFLLLQGQSFQFQKNITVSLYHFLFPCCFQKRLLYDQSLFSKDLLQKPSMILQNTACLSPAILCTCLRCPFPSGQLVSSLRCRNCQFTHYITLQNHSRIFLIQGNLTFIICLISIPNSSLALQPQECKFLKRNLIVFALHYIVVT